MIPIPRGIVIAAVAGAILAPSLLVATAAHAFPGLPNHYGRFILHDTTDPAAGAYVAIDDDLKGHRFRTLTEAEDHAQMFDLPKLSTEYEISSVVGDALPLKNDAGLTNSVGYSEDPLSDDFEWSVDRDGAVRGSSGQYLGFDDSSERLAMTAGDRYELAGSGTGESSVPIVGHVEADSIDVAKGEATICGTATSSIFEDVRILHDDSFVTTGFVGEFCVMVTGLKEGSNDVLLSQTVDGRAAGERHVEVQLGDDEGATDKGFAITTDTSQEFTPGFNTLTGTGKADATVTLKTTNFENDDDKYYTATVGDNGNWSITSWFGNGKYVFDATQTPARGTPETITGITLLPVGSNIVDKDFAITSPIDGGEFTWGPIAITGTGTAGAVISLKTTSFPNPDDPYYTTTVGADGEWTLATWLGNGPYVFDVTQTPTTGTPATITGFEIHPKA